jgi:hypothetical protein
MIGWRNRPRARREEPLPFDGAAGPILRLPEVSSERYQQEVERIRRRAVALRGKASR